MTAHNWIDAIAFVVLQHPYVGFLRTAEDAEDVKVQSRFIITGTSQDPEKGIFVMNYQGFRPLLRRYVFGLKGHWVTHVPHTWISSGQTTSDLW